MINKKVSCICPTFNRKKWLIKSIKMFMNQTYPNKELIIVDDSSIPFKSKLLKNKEVKYYHYKNRFSSIGAKRNKCLEKSTGEFITHWDDDDFNHPNRLSVQVNNMKKSKNIVVFDNTLVYDVKTKRLKRPKRKKLCDMWYMCVILSAMMFDRSIWEKVKFRDISMAEDAYFLIDAMKRFDKNILTKIKNNRLFIYTKHAKSTWKNGFNNMNNNTKWNSNDYVKV